MGLVATGTALCVGALQAGATFPIGLVPAFAGVWAATWFVGPVLVAVGCQLRDRANLGRDRVALEAPGFLRAVAGTAFLWIAAGLAVAWASLRSPCPTNLSLPCGGENCTTPGPADAVCAGLVAAPDLLLGLLLFVLPGFVLVAYGAIAAVRPSIEPG